MKIKEHQTNWKHLHYSINLGFRCGLGRLSHSLWLYLDKKMVLLLPQKKWQTDNLPLRFVNVIKNQDLPIMEVFFLSQNEIRKLIESSGGEIISCRQEPKASNNI